MKKLSDSAHGGPYDRGSSDAYYRRDYDPHWYPQGTYKGERIGRDKMSNEEIADYTRGWDDTYQAGDFKDWR